MPTRCAPRSRFGLGDQNGAHDDFVALLRTDPGYILTGQISPRVVTMFEEVQKETITTVKLVVTPPTAEVQIDGVAVKANTTLPVVIGDHTVTAKQIGYQPSDRDIQSVERSGQPKPPSSSCARPQFRRSSPRRRTSRS